jgi:hypothetical protein
LTNPLGNGDCGPISNSNFGQNNPKSTTYAPDVLTGWGRRSYSWSMTVEVQQQLASRVTMTAGYYRNWFGNFTVTDNQAVPSTNYDPYCITAPADPRLPGGGGYKECGFYDVTPASFGSTRNVVTQASNFGTQSQVNDFFGADFQARIGSRGARFGGGVDVGRSRYDQCFTVDNPQQLTYNYSTPTTPTFCHYVIPWSANLQIKLNGSYPLPMPGSFTLSGTFQSVAGPQDLAYDTITNSQVATSLNRSLAACGSKVGAACSATVLVPLIQPGTQYEARRYQTDVRVTKTVTLGPKFRVRGNVDAYNLFNANSITAINPTYGPQWLKPFSILNGRSIQFSANIDF